jgi:Zn-finger nucleic acid-binding protein
MRNCPFCGAVRKREVANSTPMCPRCGCETKNHRYRSSDIDICPECHGIWLDYGDFKKLTSERDTYADESIEFEYVRKPLPASEGYLPCPRCEALMNRENFKRISGVLIDICRDHGVWMDAGELEEIRCFVANGGLDKSQDKEIMRNKEEIERIAGRVKDLELMEKVLHVWNFKRWLLRGFWVRH